MMVRSVPPLALWVIACVVVSPLASGAPRDELVAERTLYTKTFADADGSTTYQLGTAPLHYRHPDDPGQWLDVDTTLEAGAGWVNHSTNVPVRLPPLLGAGEPIAAGPDFGIRWEPGMLRAVLFSGERIELAPPQPSPGAPVEGRADAVLYPDLYPGIDLLVEVTPGTLRLTTVMKELPFDVNRREIEAFVLAAGLEVEPHLLRAMEEHLAEVGEESTAPLHFGAPQDEHVIALAGGPEQPQLPRDPDSGTPGEIAGFLATRRVEHVFEPPASPDATGLPEGASTSTAALTAVLRFQSKREVYDVHPLRRPDPKADALTWRDRNCVHGVVVGSGAQAGFPVDVHLSPGVGLGWASSGAVVLSGAIPLWGPEEGWLTMPGSNERVRAPALCGDHRDAVVNLSVAIASFPGLRALRDKLLPPQQPQRCAPAAGAARGGPVVNLQLGYKTTRLGPTPREELYHVFPRRVPPQVLAATRPLTSLVWSDSAIGAVLQAPEYALDADVFTRSNGRLVPVANPADCGTRLQCETAFVGAWGRHTTDRDGFTFGALTRQEALDDLKAALCSGGDYFHLALSPGAFHGAEPVSATLDDLRLEITTRSVVVPAAEIEVSDPLDTQGQPDPNLKAALFPGETVRFAVDLLRLENASEVTLQANDFDLFNDYGLQVTWQRTPSGPQLYDRATLEPRPSSPPPGFNRDKAVLTVSWSHPGKRIAWTDPALRSTAMLRIGAAFPGAPRQVAAAAIPITLRDLDGQIDLGSTPRLQRVPINLTAVGPYTLRIQPGSLRGTTEMRLRLAYVDMPGAARLDPVPPEYYLLDPSSMGPGNASRLTFYPAKLYADRGPGTYRFVVEPCLQASRVTTGIYEHCREDRRRELVVEIEGDPKVDFVYRSTTQPQGAGRSFRFQVHGSDLGDPSVTRVKMSGATVTAEPKVQAGSTAATLDVLADLRSTAACGPHPLTVSRFSPDPTDTSPDPRGIWRVGSHVVNLHRGAPDSVVFEAEIGEIVGGATRANQNSSNGASVTLGANGSVSWRFRVPSDSPQYRFFLRSRTAPGGDPVGGSATLEREDASAGGWTTLRTFDWTVVDGWFYLVRLLNLSGPDVFELEPATTYRLTLRAQPNRRFPEIDMVVVALSRTPTAQDLCFGP